MSGAPRADDAARKKCLSQGASARLSDAVALELTFSQWLSARFGANAPTVLPSQGFGPLRPTAGRWKVCAASPRTLCVIPWPFATRISWPTWEPKTPLANMTCITSHMHAPMG
eukprot:4716629-Pyramimonas_sp.AAC.1